MSNSAPSRFRAPEVESIPDDRTVFRPSPMAWGAVLILALGTFSPIYWAPTWGWLTVALPLGFAWWLWRSRTRVDDSGVHVRTWRGGDQVAWDRVKGLNFPKRGGAQLVTTDGRHITLPGVGFNELPRLSAASGGRIPDPFDAPREPAPDSDE